MQITQLIGEKILMLAIVDAMNDYVNGKDLQRLPRSAFLSVAKEVTKRLQLMDDYANQYRGKHEANAKLMAVAPELLDFVNAITTANWDNVCKQQNNPFKQLADMLIQKATS